MDVVVSAGGSESGGEREKELEGKSDERAEREGRSSIYKR